MRMLIRTVIGYAADWLCECMRMMMPNYDAGNDGIMRYYYAG